MKTMHDYDVWELRNGHAGYVARVSCDVRNVSGDPAGRINLAKAADCIGGAVVAVYAGTTVWPNAIG